MSSTRAWFESKLAGRRCGAPAYGRVPPRPLPSSQTGAAPTSGLAPFRHLPVSQTGGALLPAFLILSVVAVIFVLGFSRFSLEKSRQTNTLIHSDKGKAFADAGVQLALARLDWRLAQLPARLEDAPGMGALTDVEVDRYADPNDKGASLQLLIRRLNGFDPALHPDFVDNNDGTASFIIDQPPHQVRVTLRDASDVGDAMTTGGINDVTLYYGYRIESLDTKSGRSTAVQSYAETPADLDETIQVHLSRSLSRYNLFAVNNVTPGPGGKPIYDRNSYRGPVYSEQEFFIAGDPRYDDKVMISRKARTSYTHVPDPWHDDDFRKADDSPANLALDVPDIPMPSSVQEDEQKRVAWSGSPTGPMPNPAGPGVTPAQKKVMYKNGQELTDEVAAYVKGDAEIVIENTQQTNKFHITVDGVKSVIEQDVAARRAPYFFIYVDGKTRVRGELSQGNRVTVAAKDDVVINGDILYADTFPNEDTVMGLISWNGHVLIAKDFDPDSQNKVYAVIMAPKGGFGAEGHENNFADYPRDSYGNGLKGTIYHTGSIIRGYSIPTFAFDAAAQTSWGWNLETQYDGDLANKKTPPYFPASGPYQLMELKNALVKDFYKIQ